MITIRNPNEARSRTVIANAALEVGQFVKLIENTTAGDPPKVAAVAEADVTDVEVIKGLVFYIPDDDLAVDYILDPTDSSFTKNTGDDNTYVIPSGALCNFWYFEPIVGFSADTVDAGVGDFANITAGTLVAIETATSKLGLFDATGVDTSRDVVVGYVYTNDGAELTVVLSAL